MQFLSTLRCGVLAALFLLIASAAAVHADSTLPFLHPLFTDNMVLQRGMADPVWGWTAPGSTVTVTVDGKTASATAGADGKWLARVGPVPAGGPYTLTVQGAQTVTLSNVMVGDVWLCSGQSNMEFGIGNANNGVAEAAAADQPNIRLFTVPKTIADRPQPVIPGGQWQVCTPQTVLSQGTWYGFSAAAYFFARELQPAIHVPIGLIQSSWGGTVAEAWTSAAGLSGLPDFQQPVADLQAAAANATSVRAGWYAKYDAGSAAGLGWADPALDTSAWKTMTLPQDFQDAGDPDLANINGVVWFRRTFDLPTGDTGKDAVLHLLADDDDTTWINGTQVGATDGYNVPRAYTVAASLLKPTGNIVAVRVLDTGGKGGIYGDPAGLTLDVPGATPLALGGPWSYKLGTPLPKDDPHPPDENDPNVVTVLYNSMIAPLVPFGFKGALWYQGEANAGRAAQYRSLLPAMITDWRSQFGNGSFPFLIVQLAGWNPGGEAWAELREAQMMTALNVPDAGIATAIDIGDHDDIHPKDKQDVGHRLALVAEAKVYGKKLEYYGPVYSGMSISGSAIRLNFAHLGGGLAAKGAAPLTSFEITGADNNWVAADAKIDGGSVVVSSPQVPAPVAARYAWTGFPACSLYSKDGLPAFPFRTNPGK